MQFAQSNHRPKIAKELPSHRSKREFQFKFTNFLKLIYYKRNAQPTQQRKKTQYVSFPKFV